MKEEKNNNNYHQTIECEQKHSLCNIYQAGVSYGLLAGAACCSHSVIYILLFFVCHFHLQSCRLPSFIFFPVWGTFMYRTEFVEIYLFITDCSNIYIVIFVNIVFFFEKSLTCLAVPPYSLWCKCVWAYTRTFYDDTLHILISEWLFPERLNRHVILIALLHIK